MRTVYKLKMTHKVAKNHFTYFPKGGVLKLRADILETRFIQDPAEWWQDKPEPRKVIVVVTAKGSPVTFKAEGKLWMQHNGLRCLATDFIGFLKYGCWFRYDPKDGDYCNLKWENLRRC